MVCNALYLIYLGPLTRIDGVELAPPARASIGSKNIYCKVLDEGHFLDRRRRVGRAPAAKVEDRREVDLAPRSGGRRGQARRRDVP